ncbi:MAG: cytidine deaminase, partial [candidate division Zixibacteria bacterium]|nr:cytidine deaminase [candidate division Zixibacteria bacterium]
LYVSLFPCNECAKLIVQVGINKVIYLSDLYPKDDIFIAARRMFEMAGVATEKLIPKTRSILLDFERFIS